MVIAAAAEGRPAKAVIFEEIDWCDEAREKILECLACRRILSRCLKVTALPALNHVLRVDVDGNFPQEVMKMMTTVKTNVYSVPGLPYLLISTFEATR
ncbi:hypothetical protein MRX96_010097 [Rhipicephalus microplus]